MYLFFALNLARPTLRARLARVVQMGTCPVRFCCNLKKTEGNHVARETKVEYSLLQSSHDDRPFGEKLSQSRTTLYAPDVSPLSQDGQQPQQQAMMVKNSARKLV